MRFKFSFINSGINQMNFKDMPPKLHNPNDKNRNRLLLPPPPTLNSLKIALRKYPDAKVHKHRTYNIVWFRILKKGWKERNPHRPDEYCNVQYLMLKAILDLFSIILFKWRRRIQGRYEAVIHVLGWITTATRRRSLISFCPGSVWW